MNTGYLYDESGHVIAEMHGTTWNNGYIYLNGTLVAEYTGGTSGTTEFVHTDQTKFDRDVVSILAVPESNVMIISRLANSFPTACGNTLDTTHKFTGQERDGETGNDYFMARHYGSHTGRFLTPDPLGNAAADVTNPQTWNQYAYTTNNPLALIDPTGTDPNGICDYDPSLIEEECGDLDGDWVYSGSGVGFISTFIPPPPPRLALMLPPLANRAAARAAAIHLRRNQRHTERSSVSARRWRRRLHLRQRQLRPRSKWLSGDSCCPRDP